MPEPANWGGLFCLFVCCCCFLFVFPGCCLRCLKLSDNMCLSWYIHTVLVTMATLLSHRSFFGGKENICLNASQVSFFFLLMFLYRNRLLLFSRLQCTIFCFCCNKFVWLKWYQSFFATPRYIVFGILNALGGVLFQLFCNLFCGKVWASKRVGGKDVGFCMWWTLWMGGAQSLCSWDLGGSCWNWLVKILALSK